MFDKKVKLIIPEERKVIKKRFCGKEVSLYESMTKEEILYCLDDTINIYYTNTYEKNHDAFLTPSEMYANLDILVMQLCTNIDIEGMDFETMCKIGVHDFLKDNIKNYDLMSNTLHILAIQTNIIKVLNGINNIASLDDLDYTERNLKGMLENGVPENVVNLIMAYVADNPSIANLYNSLTSEMKKDDDALEVEEGEKNVVSGE